MANLIHVYQTKKGFVALVASSSKHAEEVLACLGQSSEATHLGRLDPDEPGTFIEVDISKLLPAEVPVTEILRRGQQNASPTVE